MDDSANDRLMRGNPFGATAAGERAPRRETLGAAFSAALRIVRRSPFAMAGFAVAGIVTGVLYLNLSTPVYTASMIVGPTGNEQSGLMSMLGSSPFASLARGAGALTGDVSPFTKFQQEVYSNDVAQALMADPSVAHQAFRKQWDFQKNEWRKPEGMVADLVAFLRSALNRPAWHPPDSESLKEYIRNNVKMTEIEGSGLFSVKFSSDSREFSVFFLHALWRYSDRMLRQGELTLSSAYIDYLTNQLKVVTNSEQRQSLISLLSTQENRKMISSVDVPFSATIIENPNAPIKPTSPVTLMGLVVVPFLFLLFGVITLYFLETRRNRAVSA